MNTKHLKAKILDLAIRGKLVPQDPSEGNAADLLKKIREEKGGESLPLATAGKPSFATPSAGSNAARNACLLQNSVEKRFLVEFLHIDFQANVLYI